MDKLSEYTNKRNFSRTNEPNYDGLPYMPSDKLVYAIQHHIARNEHYDLRLEWEGVLFSWAVPKGPSFNPKDKRLAIQVEDHPLSYKDYEGVIPKGEYGGGTVMLWDYGYWQPQSDFVGAYNKGSIKFSIEGQRFNGKWALIRIKENNDSNKNWLLIKDNDEYALNNDGISQYDKSIKTNRTMSEIEKAQN